MANNGSLNETTIKLEEEILNYWENNNIFDKWKEKLKNSNKKFFFIDGPPYANGEIHLGHAWNKALKDVVLRYKRKKGFLVFDRPGFDMHGLPIEKKVESLLKLKDKTEIGVKISVEDFINKCKEFALEKAEKMIKDFKRMGIFMDWDNPYYSITSNFIANTWFGLKKAYEKNLIYEGETVNYYCQHCITVLAKHELEYKTKKDPSIFVRMKIDENDIKAKELGINDAYFLVWTTTPWTLPFNLGVIVNPKETYVLAEVERNSSKEKYIVAKKLLGIVLGVINAKLINVEKEFEGNELELISYKPLFNYSIYDKLKNENKNVFKVWLADFVSTDSGTGLVHGAPGCGPEDYEVGRKYKVKPFNLLDEKGYFGEEFKDFKGLRAKENDKKIIDILKEKGIVIYETTIEHEYPTCWRCKNPIIFKTTKQWFLKASQFKEKLVKDNNKVYWIPKQGKNAFNSWLENLQDWVISRQRYWGIPIPIWKCNSCDKWKLYSLEDKELKSKIEELGIKDLHIPHINKIEFECECGGIMNRIDDVLDVWIDSGTASWNVLDYPHDKGDSILKKFWPVDFIVEGKDQIRGWFNSLAVLSEIVFDDIPYRNVYMHGFINDSLGRKMSKSLGNVISPFEVIDQFGADTLRYYFIGGTGPGEDINYNFNDIKVKFRNLNTLRNSVKYLFDHLKLFNLDPKGLKADNLTFKEYYILHIFNSRLQLVEESIEKYELNKIPWIIEEIFLELSKWYIKSIREELEIESRRNTILKTLYEVLIKTLNIFSIIAPFITEKLYLDYFKNYESEESINFLNWPDIKENLINYKLEEFVKESDKIIESSLYLREKMKINVRWPLKKLIIIDKNNLLKELENSDYFKDIIELIKKAINVKEIEILKKYRELEDNFEITTIESFKDGKDLIIALDNSMNNELIKEGMTREIIRRVQMLRKELKLSKDIKIKLSIDGLKENEVMIDEIKNKTNATVLLIGKNLDNPSKQKVFNIKDKKIKISIIILN